MTNHDPQNSEPEEQHALPGRTTFDVSQDAEKALKRFQEEQQLKQHMAEETNYHPIEADLTLRVVIRGAATPMVVSITGDTVIGRRDPTADTLPELDLSPYGGYQMGISRRHAILRIRDKRLEVLDLGSRNGTFLNGKRLKPHQAAVVNDGAEVRLGKIVMELYFQNEQK